MNFGWKYEKIHSQFPFQSKMKQINSDSQFRTNIRTFESENKNCANIFFKTYFVEIFFLMTKSQNKSQKKRLWLSTFGYFNKALSSQLFSFFLQNCMLWVFNFWLSASFLLWFLILTPWVCEKNSPSLGEKLQ